MIAFIADYVHESMRYKLEVSPAPAIKPCACCGVMIHPRNNQVGDVNAVCGVTDCLRWQNRVRGKRYIEQGENAKQREVYTADPLSQEKQRAKQRTALQDPVKRATYNTRRRAWRLQRRQAGLFAP